MGAGNGSPGNAVKMVRSPTFFVCLGKAFYGDLGTSTGVNCFQTASKLRHQLQYLKTNYFKCKEVGYCCGVIRRLVCKYSNVCLDIIKTEVVPTSNFTHMYTLIKVKTFQVRLCLVNLTICQGCQTNQLYHLSGFFLNNYPIKNLLLNS